MAREYFCAYHSYLEGTQNLTDEELGRLIRACWAYSISGEDQDLPGNEKYIWPLIRQQIDRDAGKYESYCEKQRENGQKGGRPPKAEETNGFLDAGTETQKTQRFFEKPKKANEKEKEKEKTKEKTKENAKEKGGEAPPTPPDADKPRPANRFTPPTEEDVDAYCRERGNSVDAKSFVAFYESKGWKVGNTPMKDWRAAVRTWERRRAADTAPRASPAMPQGMERYAGLARMYQQALQEEQADDESGNIGIFCHDRGSISP